MIVSPICEMLGIKYPIFQGGMAWIADGKLAAAVSNGGGLGIISAMNAGGDYLREQIRIARSLTDKPFGVNIMLMSPHVQEVAKIVAEEKVAVVTTGAGIPNQYVPMWKEAGIKVIPVAASVAAAKMMARAGADAVIAEGGESGGHIGELSTMPLVPQVADAVDIPVLAAGGIGDGRGMAAAFMLGAVGVQMGTRFLLAEECGVHQNYKDMVKKATDVSTTATGRRFGGSKLMVPFLGKPLLYWALSATEGLFSRRVVVTRNPEAASFCAALGVETVVHDYPGRNDTVRLGLEAVGEVERCLFCPADQPLLRRQTVESLLLCGQNSRGRIWRPCFQGTPGAPILFSRDYFDELKHLPQGKGGGVVAASHGESVRTLPVADRRELWDIDTPENLTELEHTMK